MFDNVFHDIQAEKRDDGTEVEHSQWRNEPTEEVQIGVRVEGEKLYEASGTQLRNP